MEFPDFGGHCKRKEGEGPNKMRLSSLINFKLYIYIYFFDELKLYIYKLL